MSYIVNKLRPPAFKGSKFKSCCDPKKKPFCHAILTTLLDIFYIYSTLFTWVYGKILTFFGYCRQIPVPISARCYHKPGDRPQISTMKTCFNKASLWRPHTSTFPGVTVLLQFSLEHASGVGFGTLQNTLDISSTRLGRMRCCVEYCDEQPLEERVRELRKPRS